MFGNIWKYRAKKEINKYMKLEQEYDMTHVGVVVVKIKIWNIKNKEMHFSKDKK